MKALFEAIALSGYASIVIGFVMTVALLVCVMAIWAIEVFKS